ncbi:MAG: hypothetical protein WBV85_02830 [Solirubrobacteraceae bacterium]
MSETAADVGLLPIPLPVDEHGLVVERLVDAVAVAPAHQFPTGAVLGAARRREVLLDELARKLPGVNVSGAAAGLYVVIGLPEGLSEQVTLDAARTRGIAIEGVGGPSPALVVGYANLADAAVAPAVEELAASVRDAERASARDADRICQGDQR